jgi:Putative zinc-finger
MSAHVLDHLSAFLDSELEASEQQAVRLHLAACPDCQRSLAELEALDELARGLPRELDPEKGPVDLVTRVRSGLKPRRRTPVAPWWWAAAAALFLAVVPWTLIRRNARGVYTEAAPTGSLTPAQQAAPAAPSAPAEAPAKLRAEAAADEAAGSAGQRRDLRDESGETREKDRRGGDLSAPNGDKAEKEKKVTDSTSARGFAPPPAAAAAPGRRAPSAAAEESGAFDNEAFDGREAQQERQGHEAAPSAAASDRAAAMGHAGGLVGGSAETAAGGSSAGTRLSPSFDSADSARRARDRWAALAKREPDGARAEAARVAAIDAAAAAYRMERRDEDLARLRKMAREYLARAEAPAAAYVRQLLDEALAAKGP